MSSFCQTCGRARLAGEWSCPPPCGCDIYGSTLTAQPGRETESCLQGPLAGLTKLPRGGSLLLMGPRGSGKSTLGLQSLTRPVVITTEMGADLVAGYAKRLGVECARIGAPTATEDGGWSWPHGWDGAGGILVDSVTVSDPVVLLLQAMKWGQEAGLPVIAVSQVTQEGTARGGPQMEHLPDAVVRITPMPDGLDVAVLKSRFSPQSSAQFRLGEQGIQCAGGRFFYSLTGQFPNYSLSPYPWTASEVWSEVEQGKLACPNDAPCAASARKSPLYGGWVEPADVEHRRDFCARHGVAYWSPQ